MGERVDTVIVGGGQAGLSISYHLTRQQREHIVLEQAAQPGSAWRNHRWDSFTLVTPKWQIRLPGAEYQGDDPDGFMPRDEVVAYLERYVEQHRLPVRHQVLVKTIEPSSQGGWTVRGAGDVWEAANVVVATGLFRRPKIPAFAASLPPEIKQLTSERYRNPAALAPGAVLVVGSAQSGCQIAEELYKSGRRVHLCIGGAGRVPRRYRGRDITWWLYQMGWFDQTVESLPSPQARFAANPHVSGKDGGHTLNLHQFARDGVILLGHLQDVRNGELLLKPELHETLRRVDRFEADLLKMVDDFIDSNGIDALTETLQVLDDGYEVPEIHELDLAGAGITTVIWAVGYTYDFGLVKVPVVDEFGYPLQRRGVTDFPGLYFLGLPWLHTRKSGLLLGVGQDAAFIASQIAARNVHGGSRPN